MSVPNPVTATGVRSHESGVPLVSLAADSSLMISEMFPFDHLKQDCVGDAATSHRMWRVATTRFRTDIYQVTILEVS